MGTARTDRSLARGLALLSLAGLAVVTAPSCTAVLGIDGYGSAASELCDKLDKCYSKASFPGCAGKLERRVDEAEVTVREDFLVNFSRSACLSTCVSARSCLDGDPLCSRDGCSIIEDCCGFSTGGADCQDERCCATKGSACGGAGDLPCCGGAGDCNGGFCGGVPCSKAGAACTSGTQCCSHQCIGGVCSKDTCRPPGFECDTSDNCCQGVCSPSHVCEELPSCHDVQGTCQGDADCCQTSDAALFCFHPTAGSGLCSTCESALPQGSECFADTDCCAGLRCDATVTHTCVPACTSVGITCQDDGECCSGSCQPKPGGGGKVCVKSCTTGYCTLDDQCCTGKCLPGGTCAPDCQATGCDHDPCTPGAALSMTCSPPTPADPACVSAVCADDPYCCCQSWDEICVERAAGSGFPVHTECATSCN